MNKYLLVLCLLGSALSHASESDDDAPKRRDTRLPARFRDEEEIDQNNGAKKKAKSTKPKIARKPAPRKIDYTPPRLEKRESKWLLSLGISRQNGLYAGEHISKGQFLGWYEGRIYTSERKINELAPARKLIGTKKEFGYFHRVTNPKTGQYLYSIDGFQPVGEICKVAYINHKPHVLANATYISTPRNDAPGGVGMAVFATKAISKGEEITSDYGNDYEVHLQSIAPAYRDYLHSVNPKYVVKLTDDEYIDWNYLRPSQLLELFGALFDEVTENKLTTDEAERLGAKYGAVIDAWRTLDARLDKFRAPETDENASERMDALDELISGYETLGSTVLTSKFKTSAAFRYLVFKNQQRIAMAYWRKALLLFAAELHASHWKAVASLQNKKHEAINACKRAYNKTFDGNEIAGIAFATLGEALEKGSAEGEKYRYNDAETFKEMGDAILKEDSNPLKSMTDKQSDRHLAISYYRYALYLLEGSKQTTEIAGLRGHIYWTLVECHNDRILSMPKKACRFAEVALEEYQFATRDRDAGAVFDKDVKMAEVYLAKKCA